MKRKLFRLLKILIFLSIIVYIVICILFYFKQDALLFYPEKLESAYQFNFKEDFEEHELKTTDGVLLNSLLFKVKEPSGLIFYLHGNGGSLKYWGTQAKFFNDLNYDVFLIDFRGYGKSGGEISNEKQFYNDTQLAYDFVKQLYPEEEIVVLGSSLGTGAASWLSVNNHPNQVILLSPYYSIPDLKNNLSNLKILKIIPSFLLKYKFKNYENIENGNAPVTIMHSNQDDLIYFGSSVKLSNHFKPGDTLISINTVGHSIHHENEFVQNELRRILHSD